MIRINLLKKARTPAATTRGPVKFATAALIGLAAVAVLLFGVSQITRGGKTATKAPDLRSKVAPVAAVAATASAKVEKLGSNIIEDVVREVGEQSRGAKRAEFLDLPYNEFSFPEKINYEVLFTKKTIELLAKTIPAGIGIRTLEIEGFQTIYSVGFGATREILTSMFSALKTERLELLPQPYSHIKSNGNNGFRFVLTCKPSFGLYLAEPFQAIEHLSSRDGLDQMVKKFSTLAKEEGVSFKGTPVRKDGDKIGLYRRINFSVNGSCTYQDFAQFIDRLYNEKIPCAFKKVRLEAQTNGKVDMSAELIFTVRE